MKSIRLVPAFALAALAALLLGACGANPSEQEPAIRDFLRSLARANIANDYDKIIAHVVGPAGQGDNPVGAKQWDTPEGRKEIQEGNKKQIRAMFRDSGILQESDVDRYLGAVKIAWSDVKNCEVIWFISPEKKRVGEKITLRLTRTEEGWKIYDYYRDMIR